MTKERRLAVQMWREIADGIRQGTITYFGDVFDCKEGFIKKYNLKWHNNCWFCEYQMKLASESGNCNDCRLYKYRNCHCEEDDNPYALLRNDFGSESALPYGTQNAKFAKCADEIADVLEGKKDEY